MNHSDGTLTQFLIRMGALQPLLGENTQNAIVQTFALINNQAEKTVSQKMLLHPLFMNSEKLKIN